MRRVVVASSVLVLLSFSCRQQESVPADAAKVVGEMLTATRMTAVQYDFNLRLTGAQRTRVRPMRGKVIVTPAPRSMVRIEATRFPLAGERAMPERYVLSSDGTTVNMLSAAKRAVFFSPMHRAGGLLLNSRASQATLPFSDRGRFEDLQKRRRFRSSHVEEIDGVACDVVQADIPDDQERLEVAIARRDHLPRRLIVRSTDVKEPGATVLELANVRTLDRFDAKNLDVGMPAGYARREYTMGGPAAGEEAPQWTLDHAGHPLSLASLRGKIVILDFWATWCGPCRASMPALQHLYETYRSRGVEIVGATWDEKGDPDSFAREAGISYPHVKGDPIAQAYGVDHSGIPTMFLIDRDGRVADFFIGWSGEETLHTLNADLESLIAGAPVPTVDAIRSSRAAAFPYARARLTHVAGWLVDHLH